jgi:uncharacterized damage-inducible protein DinB
MSRGIENPANGTGAISVSALRQLYDYNYWARDRQLEVCSELTEREVSRPTNTSFSSLHGTFAHLLVAEWIWLERFSGRSPQKLPTWFSQLQTLDSIAQRWRRAEFGMRKFLAEVDADRLARPISYVNLEGKAWLYPLWQALLHLVNHQTYHRGQVTTILRQLGKTAPSVDFLVFLDVSGNTPSKTPRNVT